MKSSQKANSANYKQPKPPMADKAKTPNSSLANTQRDHHQLPTNTTNTAPQQQSTRAANANQQSFAPVITLINDPATSMQYSRHASQIVLAANSYTNGLPAPQAKDPVPEIIRFLVGALCSDGPDVGELVAPLHAMLHLCGQPITCTTLADQKIYLEALTNSLEAVASALVVPQAAIRVTAAIILRNVFANIRTASSDDLNRGGPGEMKKSAVSRKKDQAVCITDVIVRRLIDTWSSAVKRDVEEVVLQAQRSGSMPTPKKGGGAGQPHRHADSSSDDDEDGEDPMMLTNASNGSEPQQVTADSSPEIIVVCKALQEVSHWTAKCETMMAEGIVDLIFATLRMCQPGDRRLALCIEIAWNILTLTPTSTSVFGKPHNFDTLYHVLVGALSLGYKQKERELRNDVFVVLGLIANDTETLRHVNNDLLQIVLGLSCGAEKGVVMERINKNYHHTTHDEDLQLKQLCWDFLLKCCRDAALAETIFQWGFFGILLDYVDVHCDVPCVVAWSSLQLLTLQGHVLSLLATLATIGYAYFSACEGPHIVHEYIAECPRIALRNAAVGVLARIATTPIRRSLIDVGCIPLCIRLLQDPDYELRIDCLNLLADTIDRDPSLQGEFYRCGGIQSVLPLLTLRPAEYTDKLEALIFAAVDCVWSCIFGAPDAELSFLQQGGISALLSILESAPRWMLSLPLSCLADLLQSPHGAAECRKWRSPRSGRSGVQIILSLWSNPSGEAPPDIDALVEVDTGLGALQSTRHRKNLSVVDARMRMESGSDVCQSNDPSPSAMIAENRNVMGDDQQGAQSGSQQQQQQQRSHNNIHIANAGGPSDPFAINLERVGLEDPPEDIAHIATEQSICFKVYAALCVVGFDQHNELEPPERATLAAVEQYVALCKDEVWQCVEQSLTADGVAPISSDARTLAQLREAAEERSTRLQATRRAYSDLHAKQREEAERTFYSSLIKKTEEKRVASSRNFGLTITEAKIQKTKMLKDSFKAGRQAQKASLEQQKEATTADNNDDDATEQRDSGRSEGNANANGLAETTARENDLKRWSVGQRAMSEMEFQILECLNDVRTNPKKFVAYIEEKLQYLDEGGNTFHVPGCAAEVCSEGRQVYEEAIQFLSSTRQLISMLDVNMGVLLAARDHIYDLSKDLDIRDDGSDGSTPASRLARYGKAGRNAQLIALDHRTPTNIVLSLVVDDGTPSRAHRRAIFDPDLKVCGIATGQHAMRDMVAVIVMTTDYQDKPAEEQQQLHIQAKAAIDALKR